MDFDDMDLTYEEIEAEDKRQREERAKWQASFSPEDRLRIFNGCSFLTKADVVGDIELHLADSERSIESAAGGQLQYLKAKCTSLKQFIASSRGITNLRLMLVLCPSKQGAFVQNRATDEMYSSPV